MNDATRPLDYARPRPRDRTVKTLHPALHLLFAAAMTCGAAFFVVTAVVDFVGAVRAFPWRRGTPCGGVSQDPSDLFLVGCLCLLIACWMTLSAIRHFMRVRYPD